MSSTRAAKSFCSKGDFQSRSKAGGGIRNGETDLEDERPLVRLRSSASCSLVPWTEVALGIVGRSVVELSRLDGTLPRSLCPVRWGGSDNEHEHVCRRGKGRPRARPGVAKLLDLWRGRGRWLVRNRSCPSLEGGERQRTRKRQGDLDTVLPRPENQQNRRQSGAMPSTTSKLPKVICEPPALDASLEHSKRAEGGARGRR